MVSRGQGDARPEDLNMTTNDDISPDAMAQTLIAEFGRDHALAVASEPVDPRKGPEVQFWADVATLIRLETQSDEPANIWGTRPNGHGFYV
jgi:hypothetical protein